MSDFAVAEEIFFQISYCLRRHKTTAWHYWNALIFHSFLTTRSSILCFHGQKCCRKFFVIFVVVIFFLVPSWIIKRGKCKTSAQVAYALTVICCTCFCCFKQSTLAVVTKVKKNALHIKIKTEKSSNSLCQNKMK